MPAGEFRGVPPPRRAAMLLWTSRHELAAIAVAALATYQITRIVLGYPHPPGADGGQWLGIVQSILGTGVSSIAPLNYPPLYFILLAALVRSTGDPVIAIQASIAIIAFVLPLSAYASYVLITRDRRGALLFCLLVAFCFPLLEMLDWGGYPSLLSFVFFLPAFAFVVRASLPAAPRREFLLLGLFAGLTFLTHPLSALLFGVGSVGYFVLLQVQRRDRKWLFGLLKFSLPVFGLLVAPYYALRVFLQGSGAVSGPVVPSYLLSVPAYSISNFFFPLVPWTWRKIFPFTTEFTVLLLVLLSLLALFPLGAVLRRATLPPLVVTVVRPLGRDRGIRVYLLFICTLLPALLIPLVMWRLDYYTDYSRFSNYVCFPAAALGAALGSRLMSEVARRSASRWLIGNVARARKWLGSWFGRRDRSAHENAPVVQRSPSPRWALLSRRAGSPPARVAAAALVWVIVLLPLQSYASFSLDFHRLSADYYSQYNEPADVELARWAAANTSTSERLVLAPGFGNAFWLEGLSGRRTLGYTWDHLIYYDTQALLNRDLQHAFLYRYGVAGGSLEIVTPGGGDWRPTRFRLLVYDGRSMHHALDLIDSESHLIMNGTHRESLSGFAETGLAGHESGTEGTGFTVTSQLGRSATLLERSALLGVEGVELRVRGSASGNVSLSFDYTIRPSGSMCSISAASGILSIGVRTTPGRCVQVHVSGTSTLSTNWGKVSGTTYGWITQGASASGEATLRFRVEGAAPVIPAPSGLIDQAKVIARFGACHFVTLIRSTGLNPLLVSEHGLPVVYRNSKYLVVRSAPADALSPELPSSSDDHRGT